MDRTGRPLSPLGEPGFNVDFRISPDGNRVAAQRGDGLGRADIWLLDAAGVSSSRFTFGPAYHAAPVWFPDGTRIAYFSMRDGRWSIYERSLSREQGERLLLKTSNNLVPNDLSPDGKALIYTDIDASATGHLRPLPLPPRTDGQRPPMSITGSPSDEQFARFSPDGRWIVYQSIESGRFEVYVRAFDPTGAAAGGKWQVSTHGGIEPRWPRRGHEIFYVGPDNVLMAVTVHPGPTFEAGVPRALFSVLAAGVLRYDVTPDGQRFLVARPTEEPGAPATVVLGLFDRPLRPAAGASERSVLP